MVDFNKLKENRNNSLNKLTEELKKLDKPTFENNEDNRFWYPATDKSGNGSALIRFLPEPPNEDIPYIRLFSHSFQGPTGSWYIENSLTTLGEKDPVGEYNTKLWNSGLESDKEQARAQKRRLTFISNIYVIKDPANPENEGKVFLFRYGKKIFDKINDLMNPPDDDLGDKVEPINPFCLWNGANFKFVITTVDKYRNYDKSSFQKPGPLFNDDAKLEELWLQEHSLKEFIDASKFKPYDVLEKKLHTVLGLNGGVAATKTHETQKAPSQKSESSPFESDDVNVEEDLSALFADLEND